MPGYEPESSPEAADLRELYAQWLVLKLMSDYEREDLPGAADLQELYSQWWTLKLKYEEIKEVKKEMEAIKKERESLCKELRNTEIEYKVDIRELNCSLLQTLKGSHLSTSSPSEQPNPSRMLQWSGPEHEDSENLQNDSNSETTTPVAPLASIKPGDFALLQISAADMGGSSPLHPSPSLHLADAPSR